MKTLLFVDACIRGADSRTLRLACRLAEAVTGRNVRLKTVSLNTLSMVPLDIDGLNERDTLCRVGDFGHPSFHLARQFKNADAVLIAAPYWDLSFPSLLRVYLEQLCVCGLTFHYDEQGNVVGDCSPNRMVYITTRGGYVNAENPASQDFAQPYLRSICAMLGIPRFDSIAAEGLDVQGNDPEVILSEAEIAADTMAEGFWDAER